MAGVAAEGQGGERRDQAGHAHRRTPDARSRETVDAAAAHPVPVPRLDPTARLARRADDPVRATLALVARDALDLVTSPAAARIRDCAGPTCGVLFLDTSRPGNRRWCAMGTCGNRAKKETLRGRTAQVIDHEFRQSS